MRFLLLLLLAVGSALVMPYLVYGIQPDLMPGGGSVGDAWSDVRDIVRLVREAWGTGQEPAQSEVWGEMRLARAASVAGVAAAWFVGFLPGGILGLVLINARPTTLAIVGAVLALTIYACTKVQVQHDLSPEAVSGFKRFFSLMLAAAPTGFFATRGIRTLSV